MNRPRQTAREIEQQREIVRLRKELASASDQVELATDIVLGNLPDAVRSAFGASVDHEADYPVSRLMSQVIHVTIKVTEPIPEAIPTQWQQVGQRAHCPLCNVGPQSHSYAGWAYPDGLYKHLTGSGATSCKVISFLEGLADARLQRDRQAAEA